MSAMIQCIGGPLDGKFVADLGDVYRMIERVPLPRNPIGHFPLTAVTIPHREYRKREVRCGRDIETFFFDQDITDEQALARLNGEAE